MDNDDQRRYMVSGFLTVLLFISFSSLLFLIQLLPDKHLYGASRLTVNLSPQDLTALSAEKAPAYQPEAAKSQSETVAAVEKTATKTDSLPQEQPVSGTSNISEKKDSRTVKTEDENYVEPEFDDILTGTDFERNSSEKTVDKSEKSGVEYGEQVEKRDEAFSGSQTDSSSGRDSLLSDSQLEKLEQAGTADSPATIANPDDESSGYGSGADDKRSHSDVIVDLQDYERSRKKLSGGFPDLSGIDLAGRLYISVVVRLTVEPGGTIGSVQIIRSSGSAAIDSVLQRELRYWKFERVTVARTDSPQLRLQWRPGSEN